MVLMYLDTNDVWAPTEILAAFSRMVDWMRESKRTMEMLVAQIISMQPSNLAQCGDRVAALNKAISDGAASTTSTESPVVADCWTELRPVS